MASHRVEYDLVLDAVDVPEVDPHWLELQVPGQLPTSYLPTSMPGPLSGWRRASAWVLIGMLVATTAGGVCLTYGPDDLFRLIQSYR